MDEISKEFIEDSEMQFRKSTFQEAKLESFLDENEQDDNFKPNCLTAADIAREVMSMAGDGLKTKTIDTALKLDCLARKDKRKYYSDLLSLPKGMYLESTIVPILVNGLTYISKERPENAITALAIYLLKHRLEYEDEEELSP